jgi:acetyl-CoA carboxylase biotin carboxyl carrier protein
MTLDEIRELISLVTETGVAELEVQRGENRVRIRRTLSVNSQEIVIPMQAIPNAFAPSLVAPAAPGVASPAPPQDVLTDPSLLFVKSPIVGTFYDAPSPGAPPFVRAGDTVQPGQVLCIIESMKLMNEIEAEMAGVILSKLVTNAQPVEYGESLFAIRPV